MSNIRGEITQIVEDPVWLPLFEQRLAKNYNFQNIAFWKNCYDLHALLATNDDVQSAEIQDLMTDTIKVYMDTESSQSVALSFKAKQRFKRAMSQSVKDVTKAVNQAMGEVEMLLLSEVKSFLATAPPASKRPPKKPVAKKAPVKRAAATTTTSNTATSSSKRTTSKATPSKAPNAVPSEVKRSPRARAAPVETAAPESFVAKSNEHSFDIFTWGSNSSGQLGLGAIGSTSAPTHLDSSSVLEVCSIASANTYSAITDLEGRSYVMGELSGSGEPKQVLESHQIKMFGCGAAFSIALTTAGKLLYFGSNGALEKLPISEVVVRISCGNRHCVALTESGNVYCWGSNQHLQLGLPATEATVRKPRHIALLTDVTEINACSNSTVCLQDGSKITAWGAVTQGGAPTLLENLQAKSIVRVACSDRFVIGASDLGRVYIWHVNAVEALNIPSQTIPFTCLRTNSIFDVACHNDYVVLLTDTGDVITWGEYGEHLGQGSKSTFKRYADTPRRLPELSAARIVQVCVGQDHVIARTGNGKSSREQRLWKLFVRERAYCRALFAISEVYGKRIKIKNTRIFLSAKSLLDVHRTLVRELLKRLWHAPRIDQVTVGDLYLQCLGGAATSEIYSQWAADIESPMEKLSKPKLAGHMKEIEKEVEGVVKKTDTQWENTKSYSLVSLLKDPVDQQDFYREELAALFKETKSPSSDAQNLPKVLAILGVSKSSGGSRAPKKELPSTGMSKNRGTANLSASAGSSARPRKNLPPTGGSDSPNTLRRHGGMSTVVDTLRIKAVETENRILEESNEQLAQYVTDLENELLEAEIELRDHNAKLAKDAVLKLEAEMLTLATENAELKAKLKIAEIYRLKAIGDQSSQGDSDSQLSSKKKSEKKDSDKLSVESLRKRLNPTAGRLLSERQAGHPLHQFTFDDAIDGEGILFEGEELKAATLEKLLEHLTRTSGSFHMETFLISYRNFATPQDILRRLMYMYCVAPEAKADVVWLRILNFVKNWVGKFFAEDWSNNDELKQELNTFLDDVVTPSYKNTTALATVKMIKHNFNKKVAKSGSSGRLPIPGKPKIEVVLSDYKPAVIAEHLIHIEHEIFRSIKPGECFNQNWANKDAELAPFIRKLTARFNLVSRWVAFQIVSVPDLKERRQVVEMFIAIASLCKEEYSSFNTVMEIVAGLQSTPVFRLKKTWEAVGRSSSALFADLKQFVSSGDNYKNLRTATRTADLPCLPYIGTYLGDLTFIDVGAKDFISGGLINWGKFKSIGNVILQLQAKQRTPYKFNLNHMLHGYLYHMRDYSEAELYSISKQVEPSDRKT